MRLSNEESLLLPEHPCDMEQYAPEENKHNSIIEETCSYNCESYAIHQTKDQWYWSEFSLQQVVNVLQGHTISAYDAKRGDVFCVVDTDEFSDECDNICHYGVVKRANTTKPEHMKVRSKWGGCGLIDTPLWECASYGREVYFVRPKNKRRII